MFDIVKQHFAEHLQRMTMRMALQAEREAGNYASGIGVAVRANLDLQQEMVDISCRLVDAKRALESANTRAAKNAALALLAFGLIAIEVLALALYFLPK